jgi:hypothetical protein
VNSGSLKTSASELASYNLELEPVKEIRWDTGVIEPADDD